MSPMILLPEWAAFFSFLCLFLTSLYSKKASGTAFANAALILSLTVAAALWIPGLPQMGSAFGEQFISDPLAIFFKFFFALSFVPVIQITREYFCGRAERQEEFYLLLFLILTGLFFLVSAGDFIVMFIALEIVTLSFYVLTAHPKTDAKSIEAALKYLVLGSIASAFFIFGAALVFSQTGSLNLTDTLVVYVFNPDNLLMNLGLALILSAICFKIAAFPFQLWVPDVYEGAPTPVTAALSVLSKSAGFALLIRLLFYVVPSVRIQHPMFFVALTIMTLLYGNLGALRQTNIKRLFAYSSIGHAGYLLMAVTSGDFGLPALLYYLIAYGVTNLTAFLVIVIIERHHGSAQLEAFRGLAVRSPFLAGIFFMALLSLAGVPPLAGFFAKFGVLLAAIKAGLPGLALIGALFVAVSLYYYLGVVRTMYFEEPVSKSPVPVNADSRVFLILGGAAIVFTGLAMPVFMNWIQKIVRA